MGPFIVRPIAAFACLLMWSLEAYAQRPATEFLLESGVSSNGLPSASWTEAIKNRLSDKEGKRILRNKRKLTSTEGKWSELIRREVTSWNSEQDRLTKPFKNVTPPRTVHIIFGNQGGDDGFTASDNTIGIDVSAWEKNYSFDTTAQTKDRIQRILSHEFTHILHKAWLKRNPVPLDNAFERALWECLYEGMGNLRSLSAKWLPKNGVLPPLSKDTLSKLSPIFVERLIRLNNASTQQEENEYSAGLSSGTFQGKWGAIPVALWLAIESEKNEAKLEEWVSQGPHGVLLLAEKYLPKNLWNQLETGLGRVRISDNLRLIPLKNDMYVVNQVKQPYQANGLLVVNGNEFIIADSKNNEADAAALVEWIKKQNVAAKITVISSHFHPDASGSNAYYKGIGAAVYTSEMTNSILEMNGRSEMKGNRTFKLQDATKLQAGDEPIEIIFPGHSHSPDDVVIYFPKRKVLFGSCLSKPGGDLGYLGDAEVASWRKAMDRVKEIPAEFVVPGHNSDYRPSVIGNTIRLLDEALNKAHR